MNKAESKVTMMVAVMIILFMVAWTPYSIFALMEQFGPGVKPSLAVLPALLAKSSICYNPIIYVGMNTQVGDIWNFIGSINNQFNLSFFATFSTVRRGHGFGQDLLRVE